MINWSIIIFDNSSYPVKHYQTFPYLLMIKFSNPNLPSGILLLVSYIWVGLHLFCCLGLTGQFCSQLDVALRWCLDYMNSGWEATLITRSCHSMIYAWLFVAVFPKSSFANLFPFHVWNHRYFIVKSCNRENLELSVQQGVWATQRSNEAKLNEAFDSVENVILIFSVNRTRHFQVSFGFSFLF